MYRVKFTIDKKVVLSKMSVNETLRDSHESFYTQVFSGEVFVVQEKDDDWEINSSTLTALIREYLESVGIEFDDFDENNRLLIARGATAVELRNVINVIRS